MWNLITEADICTQSIEPPNSRNVSAFIRQLQTFGGKRKGRWDSEDNKIAEAIFQLARTLG